MNSLSRAALLEDWRHGGFGLYVHWPFCEAKCPYCDFNSHVVSHVDQRRWQRAFTTEIDRIGAGTDDRILNSIFFGGGTPSLMHPETVASVLDKARATWRFANDIEITLEANPTSVEADRFVGYADAGVNRVSLGVQALNDEDLKRLGRLHSAADALKAIETARTSFVRVSFDLIYARQDQSLADWDMELRQALSMGMDHLSLYQLTIEPGTAFGRRFDQGGLKGLPGEDLAADLFEQTQELCDAAGMPAYETSNHAVPGQESIHNKIYWNGGDYAGIGPGAHGRLTLDGTRYATETPLAPMVWLSDVEKHGSGEGARLALDTRDIVVERILMGLRFHSGIDKNRLLETGYDLFWENAQDLLKDGFLEEDADKMRLAQHARPLLNRIVQTLLDGY